MIVYEPTVRTEPLRCETTDRAVLSKMIGGARITQAICVAAVLNIPDLLADGPCTLTELAERSQTHTPSLYRLLRAVASLGLLVEEPDNVFRLTPMGELLRSAVPGSLRGLAVLSGHQYWWRSLGELRFCVETGKPAPLLLYGIDEWHYLATHPDVAGVFNAAMSANSQEQIPAILNAYDFSSMQNIVDIGGGQGVLLAALLLAHSHMRGVLFDQPAIVSEASAFMEAKGLADRVSRVGGDLFGNLPPGGDGYILKLVLHDWDDVSAGQILRNLRRCMDHSAKLVLVERVILPGNEPQDAKLVDLTMLVSPGGRERSAPEWDTLLRRGGFVLTRIVPTRAALSVLECVPADGSTSAASGGAVVSWEK